MNDLQIKATKNRNLKTKNKNYLKSYEIQKCIKNNLILNNKKYKIEQDEKRTIFNM